MDWNDRRGKTLLSFDTETNPAVGGKGQVAKPGTGKAQLKKNGPSKVTLGKGTSRERTHYQ